MKSARPQKPEASALEPRRNHTAVVECNGALFVETPHLATLFDRPQLRRLGMAEEVFARAVDSLMGSDAHHRAINEQGKVAVLAFAAATGGREVPGVDRGVRRLIRQSGVIHPQLVGLLLVSAPAVVAVLAVLLGGL